MKKYHKVVVEADGFGKYTVKFKKYFFSKWEYIRRPSTYTLHKFERLSDAENMVKNILNGE